MTTSRSKGRVAPAMLLALLIVVVVAIGLAIWMSSEPDKVEQSQTAPTPAATASSELTGVRALDAGEQQARAAGAVFGGTDKAIGEKDGERTVTRPERLIWDGDRAILITAMQIEDGCHACSGALGVYYLTPRGEDGLTVTGKWPEAIDGSSWGAPPANWRVSDKFTSDPVVYAVGGGTSQGYSCATATLTQLADAGPKTIASIPMHYDNSGSVMSSTQITLDGTIANIVADRSFDVRYTGTETFTDHYIRQGDHYVVEGEARMQSC